VAEVVSAHGRDPARALAVVRSGARVGGLTDSRTGPRGVRRAAPAGARVVVCELLGTDDEHVIEGTAAEIAALSGWREPNVVVVDPGPVSDSAPSSVPDSAPWRAARSLPRGWALPDDDFSHRDSMVTKAEVRAWALARLGPAPGVLVWDVGSGSGSVGVECARLGAAVVAVDRDPEQCTRTRDSAARHGVRVEVVQGAAPGALVDLPAPDAVFDGGVGLSVVEAVAAHRPPVVVVALAALDRVAPVRACLLDAGYRVEGVQLAASRLTDLPGGSVRLAATNPVVVLTGVLP
ncbi:MAG: methyltransferase domain-containing protein, partial [Pseudorhodobacter sp.]|nr:methyltransferase domain-containing protein [Frankiaceae bacterium]